MAKIQQSLPEMKRNGSTVLGALWGDLMYSKSSTSLAGGVLAQIDFIPKLSKQLQEDPDAVIADFETIRKICTWFLLCRSLTDRSYSDRPFWTPFLCGWQRSETQRAAKRLGKALWFHSRTSFITWGCHRLKFVPGRASCACPSDFEQPQ